MYSLFKLAPYDKPCGIDEKQSNFNDLTASLRESGERTVTIAPETGSDRLRRVVNKTVTNDEIR